MQNEVHFNLQNEVHFIHLDLFGISELAAALWPFSMHSGISAPVLQRGFF